MIRGRHTYLVCVLFLKFIFFPVKLLFRIISWIYRSIRASRSSRRVEEDPVPLDDIDESTEEPDEEETSLPEIPEMQQIFRLSNEMVVGVQYVSMCPDETAHIRIIGEEEFTPLFKRKVYREKTYDRRRYIKVSNEKHYLNSNTQAVTEGK